MPPDLAGHLAQYRSSYVGPAMPRTARGRCRPLRPASGAKNIRRSVRAGGAIGSTLSPSSPVAKQPAGSSTPPSAIEALNAKLRRAVRTRGHLPNDDAAMKLSYLVLNHAAEERKRSSREWVEGLCHGNLILLANLIFLRAGATSKIKHLGRQFARGNMWL